MVFSKEHILLGILMMTIIGSFANHADSSINENVDYGASNGRESFYNSLNIILHAESYTKAISNAKEYLAEAKTLSDTDQLAFAYYNLGYLQLLKGDNNRAFNNITISYRLFKMLNNEFGAALCMDKIGRLLRRQGSYNESYEYLTRALDVFKNLNDSIGIINTYNNIGLHFRQTDNYPGAIEFYNKALFLAILKNDYLLTEIYNNIGSYYWHQNEYDSALYYYRKAINKKSNNLEVKTQQCAAINNIGNVYRRTEKFDSAFYYYDIAISQSRLSELSNLEAVNLKNYGIIYTKQGDFKRAQNAFEQSLLIAHKIKLKRIVQLNYLLLSELSELKNDYKNALFYFQKYSQVKDSIYAQEQINIIDQYETEYDLEVTAKEDAIYLKKIAEKNLSIKQQENLITIYFASILCLIIIIVFVFYRNQKNKRAKEKFQLLNDSLEEKVEVRTQHLNNEIAEHKLTGIKLLEAKEKAEESDRLKSAFLANMSHEIRIPMNGILGFANLLLMPDLSSENTTKYIGIIKKSGERLLNTINDIIDISKIDSHQMPLIFEEVNITEQISELFDFFEPQCKQKGLSFIVNNSLIPNSVILKTDKTKFNSILSNLIKNAIKFTDKGEITIDCTINKEQLMFSVVDTGIGVPLNRQNAIFNRFEQADIEDVHAKQGSGLGLSIAKSYAEMLKGEIWMESEEGQGSTFNFNLPLLDVKIQIEANPNIELETDKAEQTKINTSKLKILIAEDDEVSATYFTTILEDIDCTIIMTQTGIETVEQCRNNSDIDIILMDIKMTKMDGYQATRKIREFNNDVFIIAQTAYAFSKDREKALQAGCNEYISKPINKEELLALISKYLERVQSNT